MFDTYTFSTEITCVSVFTVGFPISIVLCYLEEKILC